MKALLVRDVSRRGDTNRSSPGPSLCIVGVIGAIAGLVIGPHQRYVCFGESKVDVARATVKMYAFEAYPSWREVHGQVCPVELVELNDFMHTKDLIRDPWGGCYQMRCGESRIAVRSAGEDGAYGTDDDVRSD